MKYNLIVEKNKLVEEAGAGFSRILDHINSGIPFIMLTAYRSDLSSTENVKRNKELASKIDLPFIQVKGGYKEDISDTAKEERSFFVMGKGTEDDEKLVEIANIAMKEYDQDSVLVRLSDSDDIFLLYPDGKVEIISNGKVNLTDVEEFWSDIKGKRFVFESLSPVIDMKAKPKNSISYQSIKKAKKYLD